jgi:demethylmenaquinone methyltransferase/2-methoxy-6-polyprenyl-1,4-benzoquinol methylase
MAFLRDRHYRLQQFFQAIPQDLFKFYTTLEFVSAFDELEKRGFETTDLKRFTRVVSTSRVLRSREEARENYDDWSSVYDYLSPEGLDSSFREVSVEMLGSADGDRVLEIGFGTGRAIVDFARRVGAKGEVHGIDISEGMMNEALRRIKDEVAKERSLPAEGKNIHLVCRDANPLPYKDQTFDQVYVAFTLEVFDTLEIPVMLEEIRRVLKDEGRLCVIALAKRSKEGFFTKVYEWLHEKVPSVLDFRPIFVQETVQDAKFTVLQIKHWSTFGVPADIVLAKK